MTDTERIEFLATRKYIQTGLVIDGSVMVEIRSNTQIFRGKTLRDAIDRMYLELWCLTCDRPMRDCACSEHGGTY